MKPRAIAVGGICLTTIYRVDAVPPLPAKAVAHEACRVVDGMAVSAACGFARLGGEARLWGRVGDDPQGASMRAELAAEGIDVSAVRAVPGGRSSHAAVVVDAAGERLVVPHHDPTLDPAADWLPLDDLRGVDMLLCDVRWPEGSEAALRAARRLGVPSMLDGEVSPPELLRRLVPLARYAVFSDAGLFALAGTGELETALRRVAATYDGHVGASCGAAGYAWLEGDVVRRVPAPRVEAVDTLAAGDIFHGALALALAEGRPIDAAARFACTAAALKCTRFGGRLGCPTRQQVEEAGG